MGGIKSETQNSVNISIDWGVGLKWANMIASIVENIISEWSEGVVHLPLVAGVCFLVSFTLFWPSSSKSNGLLHFDILELIIDDVVVSSF